MWPVKPSLKWPIMCWVLSGTLNSTIPTKFLQPVNLAILTIWSLFNPLAVPAPHCCHPFSPTDHLLIENHRSLIQICITPSLESTPWFIPSALPVISWLTSSFSCQLISITITTLIIHHSFTLSLQAQNLPFQQILPTLIVLLPWTAFTITGLDRTDRASRFILSFSFNFFVCPMWWTPSSRMCVMNYNWSATKQCLHPQSVVEISRRSVLSGDRIRQCGTSPGSHHKDTDQCL